MKSLRVLPAGATMVVLLIVFCSQAFSQARGLRAVNDTIDLYPGIPVTYDILANDTIPAGAIVKMIYIGRLASASLTPVFSITKSHDTAYHWTITFQVGNLGYDGELPFLYRVWTLPFDSSTALISIRIHDKSYGYLDVNNVNARFNAYGPNFFYDDPPLFQVPKGSGKTSLQSGTIWVGGTDGDGYLHFAGEEFGTRTGFINYPRCHDFSTGPVMDSIAYPVLWDSAWNHVWKLRKSEIDYHRANYWKPGYVPIHDILTWPGNGNPALGQAQRLAPFSDRNGNGKFEPYDGDYPEIRGDMALYTIMNDDRAAHTESLGRKLRIEVHEMAYAYDIPGDTAFQNTIFVNYRIINRSQETYDSTLFGVFTAMALGYYYDDYIGCDVERGMYYVFNGKPVDGNGQSFAYGSHPPAQSVTLLAGPRMDPDGIDNPRTYPNGSQRCDASINGMNFGDSVVDNERLGLQNFMVFNSVNTGIPEYMSDPVVDYEYYGLMKGLWKDKTQLSYGGLGHVTTGALGPDCRYMFPGLSDSLNWGVGCQAPNGPVNWAEYTIQSNPGTRRGVGVTGPVTFLPGDSQELDIAYVWARDYSGTPFSSLDKLRQMNDVIRQAFAENRLPDGSPIYGTRDVPASDAVPFRIFPNPASGTMNIAFSGSATTRAETVEILTSQGRCIRNIRLQEGQRSLQLDLTGFSPGLYLVRMTGDNSSFTQKLVVIH